MSTVPVDVPAWAPAYSIGFRAAVRRFWSKYARFDGRASRAEYWWTYLFLAIGYAITLTVLYGGLGLWYATSDGEGVPTGFVFPIGVLLTVGWFIATVVPWLALEARRLHDANLSGFLLFIHLASWPGALVVFILTQLSPNPLGRRFDAPPGEPPRFGRVGVYPPAPGEPDVPLTVVTAGQPPAAPPRPVEPPSS